MTRSVMSLLDGPTISTGGDAGPTTELPESTSMASCSTQQQHEPDLPMPGRFPTQQHPATDVRIAPIKRNTQAALARAPPGLVVE